MGQESLLTRNSCNSSLLIPDPLILVGPPISASSGAVASVVAAESCRPELMCIAARACMEQIAITTPDVIPMAMSTSTRLNPR